MRNHRSTERTLVLDDTPTHPPRSIGSPRRDKLFGFVAGEVLSGRGFPSTRAVNEHMGWTYDGHLRPMLSSLRAHGLLIRYLVNGNPRRPVWELTEKGIEVYRTQYDHPDMMSGESSRQLRVPR
jgi:hypothetical protein